MWAFYYLRRKTSYEDAMRDILIRGGDTDTNAAIIGGLIGAVEGFEHIREEWRDKVLSYEYEESAGFGHLRDDFLSPKKYFIPLLSALYVKAPISDEFYIL